MEQNEGFIDTIISSFKYGVSDVKRTLAGGIVYFISCFLLAIPIAGYVSRAMREISSGNKMLPPFNDWMGMIVDSLKFFIVALVYALAIVIVTIIPSLLIVAGAFLMDSSELIGWALIIIGIIVLLIAMLFVLLLVLMFMLGWVLLALTGSMVKAINPLETLKLMIKKPVALATMIVQLLIVAIVVSILCCFVVTIPWAGFIGFMAIAYILTKFYQNATA